MERNAGTETKAMPINIGIEEKDREEIAQGLAGLLADTYTLYLKTHKYHWNVTGPMFQTLHLMFEQQYNELALAVDQIAERIRALGFFAPGSYREFSRLSSIKEEEDVIDAREMIRLLVEGQEAIIRTARSIFPIVDRVSDQPTADLLTQRLQVHEKTAWMLRSLLAEQLEENYLYRDFGAPLIRLKQEIDALTDYLYVPVYKGGASVESKTRVGISQLGRRLTLTV